MPAFYDALHHSRLAHWWSQHFLTERSAWFRGVYGLLRRIDRDVRVERGGAEVVVPIRDGIGLANLVGGYEPWLDRVVAAVVPAEGGVVVDVGANVGQTLLKVVPRVPGVRYVAVEPNAACVGYLRGLVAANGFERVDVAETALAGAAGAARLQVRYPGDLLATTTQGFRAHARYARTLDVPATTGDALADDLGLDRLDLLKIDVEGGEADVIAGFPKTLRQFRPVVVCEILPVETREPNVTRRRTDAAARLLATLAEAGYRVRNVETGATVGSVGDLSGSLDACNYLLLPHEVPDPLSA